MCAAAQCAHAAVAVVEDMRQTNKLLLRQWEEYGSAKIAVKCPSQAELVSRLQRYSCDISVTQLCTNDVACASLGIQSLYEFAADRSPHAC